MWRSRNGWLSTGGSAPSGGRQTGGRSAHEVPLHKRCSLTIAHRAGTSRGGIPRSVPWSAIGRTWRLRPANLAGVPAEREYAYRPARPPPTRLTCGAGPFTSEPWAGPDRLWFASWFVGLTL